MDLGALLPPVVVGARVRPEPVPPTLPGARRLADWLEATPDEVLYAHAGIRVLVRGTEDVLVDVDDGADVSLVAPLLYGHVTRTLLLHAGTFCLHASVVRLGDTVLAIGGHNAAGKSTTATALTAFHDGAFLVDDVAPTRAVHGRAQVQVFERPIHLTVDAIERLGLVDAAAGMPVRRADGKVAMPGSQFGAVPGNPPWVDLDRLFALLLQPGPADGAAAPRVVVRDVSGAERLRWVVRLSNVTGLAALGDRAADYFAWTTGVADALAMTEITRPDGCDTLSEVCSAVLSGISG